MVFQPDFGSEYTFNFISGVTVSTEDDDTAQNINIYPNPTSGEARIELSGFYGSTKMDLLSQTGLLINTEIIVNHSSETITTYTDLSALAAGIYFLKVSHKSSVQTFRLIKI